MSKKDQEELPPINFKGSKKGFNLNDSNRGYRTLTDSEENEFQRKTVNQQPAPQKRGSYQQLTEENNQELVDAMFGDSPEKVRKKSGKKQRRRRPRDDDDEPVVWEMVTWSCHQSFYGKGSRGRRGVLGVVKKGGGAGINVPPSCSPPPAPKPNDSLTFHIHTLFERQKYWACSRVIWPHNRMCACTSYLIRRCLHTYYCRNTTTATGLGCSKQDLP